MVPETAAPGAEMRPSVMVRVEELDDSQLPLGHDRDIPLAIKRTAGKGGCRSGDAEKSGTGKRADAVAAHESFLNSGGWRGLSGNNVTKL
jgi:hypothetical protein